MKTWDALSHVGLQRMPETPAMAKWTGCSRPSRWYVLLTLFHRVLPRGWSAVYNPAAQDDDDQLFGFHDDELQPLHDESSDSGSEDGDVETTLGEAGQVASNSLAPADADGMGDLCLPKDEVFQRAERARAKKGGNWVCGLQTPMVLTTTLMALRHHEAFMEVMFEQQKSEAWTGHNGLDSLPLVQLAVPWKSPAARCVHNLLEDMSREPVDALALVVGLPGVSYKAALSRMFHSYILAISTQYVRTVLPYSRPLWVLAMLLHSEVPFSSKQHVLSTFLSIPKEDLDVGASQAIHGWCGGQSVEALLSHGSFFLELLVTMFTGRTTNIACEDNFARASSMRQFLRGRAHSVASMACKHVAAEFQHIHGCEVRKQLTKKAEATRAARSSSDGISVESESKPRATTWTEFVKHRFASSEILPGETRGARHKRLWADMSDSFRSEDSQDAVVAAAEESKIYRAAARQDAMEPRQSMWSLLSRSTTDAVVSTISGQADLSDDFSGPWGCSNLDWVLSVDVLAALQAEAKSFVESSALEWREKHGELIESPENDMDSDAPPEEPDFSKYGGSLQHLSRSQMQHLLKYVGFFKDVVRSHRHARDELPRLLLLLLERPAPPPRAGALGHQNSSSSSAGPGCSSSSSASGSAPQGQQTRSSSVSSKEVKVFLLVNVVMKPLSVFLWEMEVAPHSEATECEDAGGFPSRFVASLKSILHRKAAGCDAADAVCLPAITPMHKYSYRCAHSDSVLVGWKLVQGSSYEIVSFKSVSLCDASAFHSIDEAQALLVPPKPQHEENEDDLVAGIAKALNKQVKKTPEKPKRNTSSTTPSAGAKAKAKAKAKAQQTSRNARTSQSSRAVSIMDNDYDNPEDAESKAASDHEVVAINSDDEDGLLLAEWLHAADVQDPAHNPRDNSLSFAAFEEDERTYQDSAGYVYDLDTDTKIGRITDSLSKHATQDNHITIVCYRHANCSTIRSCKALDWGADAKLRAWLRWGFVSLPDRDKATEHKSKSLGLFLQVLYFVTHLESRTL